MEKDWTDKMKVAEYNKLCDYCRENGYYENHSIRANVELKLEI